MSPKNKNHIVINLFFCIAGIFLIPIISSCGKASTSTPNGLDIEYEVLNLSPDLFPVNLYINFDIVNTNNPFTFGINQGYFYVPSLPTTAVPYQFRSASVAATPLFSMANPLTSGARYTLFIVGDVANNSVTQIFTTDTATEPAIGRGKVRFVDASPSGTGGLNVTANGTLAFSNIVYPKYSSYIELPVGNYDFQITATGGTGSVLNDMPGVTIQDGRLYTLYAYGYTTRIDSAAFNAGLITNQ